MTKLKKHIPVLDIAKNKSALNSGIAEIRPSKKCTGQLVPYAGKCTLPVFQAMQRIHIKSLHPSPVKKIEN